MHNFSDMLLLFSSHSLISLCSTISLCSQHYYFSIRFIRLVSIFPILLVLQPCEIAQSILCKTYKCEWINTWAHENIQFLCTSLFSYIEPFLFLAIVVSCTKLFFIFHHHSFPFTLVHSYIHSVSPIFSTAVHPTNLVRIFNTEIFWMANSRTHFDCLATEFAIRCWSLCLAFSL